MRKFTRPHGRLIRPASTALASPRRLLPALAAIGVLLTPGLSAQAAPVPPPTTLQGDSPFTVTGFIQTATVDNGSDTFSGGTLTVNDLQIIVPSNTLFQFPATTMTWQEMFKFAPAPYGPSQSGLALNDSPVPFATYEVTVLGNRVGDRYIAGLIFLSQQSLNQGQGFINAIDYSTGELWIGSTLLAKTGARVQINTPQGRYGRPMSPDKRFAADEDNPTIRAATGFPMCIPRSTDPAQDDALCPQKNRPADPVTGTFASNFQMPGIGEGTFGPYPPLGPNDPDATQQAPFEIGDWVTYSGTLSKDGAGQFISAHTIVANVAVFTAPGSMPAYVAIQDMTLGVGGAPNPLFPQEAVEKLIVTAFTTDPTAIVDFYALDVDACAKQSDRFYISGSAAGPGRGGVVLGRVRARTTVGDFLPATREMRAVSHTLTRGFPIDEVLPTAKTYANGLVAGQYHAPNFNFVFPENLVLGGPPTPMPFEEFPFLANGTGPYYGFGSTASTTSLGTLGQLNPWPGPTAPSALACGPAGELKAPNANAGPSQTVNAGALVTLDGTASADTNNPPLPLSYTWVQTGGPNVTLNDSGTAHPNFIAPPLAAGTTSAALSFSLVVCNGYTTSGIAGVTINEVASQAPVVNAGADQQVNSASSVTLTGSAADPAGTAGSPLSYTWTQTAGPNVTLTGANTASATFTAPTMTAGQGPVTLSFKLTVTNKLGASGTGTTNVTVKPLPDTLTVVSAIWTSKRSRLSVTVRDSVTNGVPVLTLHIPGQPDVPMVFDPATLTYVAGVPPAGTLTVNPAPSTINVTSSFGGQVSSSVQLK